MTSKEKKNLVLKEIVKPLLKKAGYRSFGNVYYSQRADCCLALCLKGGNPPHFLNARQQCNLSIETIRKNEAVYHQIQRASPWPEKDDWGFIISVLDAEETALGQAAERPGSL